jgi:hypothetical protein
MPETFVVCADAAGADKTAATPAVRTTRIADDAMDVT